MVIFNSVDLPLDRGFLSFEISCKIGDFNIQPNIRFTLSEVCRHVSFELISSKDLQEMCWRNEQDFPSFCKVLNSNGVSISIHCQPGPMVQVFMKTDLQVDGSDHDVAICCADGTIGAHQCVLKSANSYFRALLSSKVGGEDKSTVEMEEDKEVIMPLLVCLYGGKLSADLAGPANKKRKLSTELPESDMLVKIYLAADKYSIDTMKEHIMNHISCNTPLTMVLKLAKAGWDIDDAKMMSVAAPILREWTEEVKKLPLYEQLAGEPNMSMFFVMIQS